MSEVEQRRKARAVRARRLTALGAIAGTLLLVQPAYGHHVGNGLTDATETANCPPAPIAGATGTAPSVERATVTVTSLPPDDPTPTVGSTTLIKLSGATDLDASTALGGIAYYCGSTGYAHTTNSFHHTYTEEEARSRETATLKTRVVTMSAVDFQHHESPRLDSARFYLNRPPTASFTAPSTAPVTGRRSTFRSTSTDSNDTNGSGGITRYDWEFDGNGSIDGEGPAVDALYTAPGTYTVRLHVTDTAGSKRSVSKQVTVAGAPLAPPAQAGTARPVTVFAAPAIAGGQSATARGRCANLLRGTARANLLTGTRGGDRVLGFGGNDRIDGDAGEDCLVGGTGGDRLRGASGADALSGGAGRDRLSGGSGNDRLNGGSGADVLAGDGGVNRYVAGGGNDRIDSTNGRRETVVCGGGRDSVRADALDRLRGCERVVRAR